MTDNSTPNVTPPTTPTSDAGDIAAELRELGKTITAALNTVWESDERKRVQKEIETGLVEAGNALKKAANDFSQSPTGQNVKSELHDFHQRVQNGEVEAKIRSDILTALRAVNSELKKATAQQQPPTPPPDNPTQA